MSNKVLIKEYVPISGKLLPTYPLVDIYFTELGKDKKITALIDTGYDGTLLLSNESARKLKLPQRFLIQDEPYDIVVANNEIIEAYLYRTKIRLGNIEGKQSFSVVSKDGHLIWDAVLGRSALYRYEILFDEKSEPKKLIVSE